MKMENVKVYQILVHTLNGIVLAYETTDKDDALHALKDCAEFEKGEALLVEVLRTSSDEGYYLKDDKGVGKYIHLNG